MIKQYVIYDIVSKKYFSCFSSVREDEWREQYPWTFPDLERAEQLLERQFDQYPDMATKKCVIIPMYTAKNYDT